MPRPPTLTSADVMPLPSTHTGADAGARPYGGALPLLLYTLIHTTLPYRCLRLSMAARR